MIDFHRRDIAEHEIRAFLCYGQILHPEEMILRQENCCKAAYKCIISYRKVEARLALGNFILKRYGTLAIKAN
jgi:hypothetical protein